MHAMFIGLGLIHRARARARTRARDNSQDDVSTLDLEIGVVHLILGGFSPQPS